jgi:hypothetical protein
MLFEEQKHQYFARRHSLTAAYVNSKAKAVIRGGRADFLCVTRRHSLYKTFYCLEKLNLIAVFKIKCGRKPDKHSNG